MCFSSGSNLFLPPAPSHPAGMQLHVDQRPPAHEPPQQLQRHAHAALRRLRHEASCRHRPTSAHLTSYSFADFQTATRLILCRRALPSCRWLRAIQPRAQAAQKLVQQPPAPCCCTSFIPFLTPTSVLPLQVQLVPICSHNVCASVRLHHPHTSGLPLSRTAPYTKHSHATLAFF
jgi:hypothetical protein